MSPVYDTLPRKYCRQLPEAPAYLTVGILHGRAIEARNATVLSFVYRFTGRYLDEVWEMPVEYAKAYIEAKEALRMEAERREEERRAAENEAARNAEKKMEGEEDQACKKPVLEGRGYNVTFKRRRGG